MNALVQWISENPVATIAIVVYVLANVLPRPHPDDNHGVWAFVWGVLDRLSVLTADGLPGKLKMILRSSPRTSSRPSVDEIFVAEEASLTEGERTETTKESEK